MGDKDLDSFVTIISVLNKEFLQIGAVRAYYLCEKTWELFQELVISEKTETQIWNMYPLLIEFMFDYLYFLDFKMLTVLREQTYENSDIDVDEVLK